MVQHRFLKVYILIGAMFVPCFAFADIIPKMNDVNLDMQYCEEKSLNSNQNIILKMKLLSQISEQQNAIISGTETLKENDLNTNIHLSTQSYQTVNDIYFKSITFNKQEFVCAYKKR